MLKQKRPDEDKAKKTSYSIGRKTAAFFRGLNKFGPLLEVAREGLSNGYRLPQKTEHTYAKRIGRVNNKKHAFDSLALGISPAAQEVVTREVREYFECQARTLSSIRVKFGIRTNAHMAQDVIDAHVSGVINDMKRDVREIRKRSEEMLGSGKMTSEKAVENLKAIVELPQWNF